jgi:hypothetical protein
MCLEATGRLCNSLFLPYAGLSTDVDIDTFIKNFNNAFPGERKLVKIGDVIYYEYFQGAGSQTAPAVKLLVDFYHKGLNREALDKCP